MKDMRWEYKIIDTISGINPDSEEDLNYLGQENWELCSIGESLHTGFKRFYFKRPSFKRRYPKDE